MRFFDLVKQDHTVRVAAHFFGELAAFLRRYDKPVTACADIPQAVAQLLENTLPDGAAVCCGSLYLLGDVAQALETI